MTSGDEEKYLATLRVIRDAGGRFAVVGTFGLGLQLPHLRAGLDAKDCDLFAENTLENLERVVSALSAEAWRVTAWNSEVQLPLSPKCLVGKFYLRATKDAFTIDITYESPCWTWARVAGSVSIIEAVPVASVEETLLAKRHRNLERDRDVLEKVKRHLNHAPVV